MTAEDDPIVVISWWSNCLGLACVQSLAEQAAGRQVIVTQVGKSEEQKARFRRYLPPGIMELPYPETAPGEHARVLAHLVFEQLHAQPGLWFLDHDTLFHEPIDGWLRAAERRLREDGSCLCLRASPQGSSITGPIFWISPERWPPGLRSFDPVPFRVSESARRPDVFRSDGDMAIPVADTLVQQRDALAARSIVGEVSACSPGPAASVLPPLPAHTHLGGLWLFSGPVLPAPYVRWMESTASRFAEFFAACPPEWRAIEDATLLRRCEEFLEAVRG
jgi:hypothetical protein